MVRTLYQSTVIHIGHNISIDKGNNWNEIAEEYCTRYASGKFVVLKSFKGDLEEGFVYQYGRQGDTFKRMNGTDFPIHSNKTEVGKTFAMYFLGLK